MKRSLLLTALVLMVFMACGSGDPVEDASPLSVIPEVTMISVVLNDPAGVVRNIDNYITTGAPILGETPLENLICSQLDIPSLDSMTTRYGFDPSGQVVFWMESALPQSIGMAASAPDFPLFVSLLEELGAELTVAEPVSGEDVYTMDTETGTVYLSGTRGVVLMAMSSAKLEGMISALAPMVSPEEVSPSLTMKFNLAMIGPLAAAQMPMARMMMMQGFSADSTMPAFVPGIMDVYMDGIEVLLSQADVFEFTLLTGPEDFVVQQSLTFLPGSALYAMLSSSETQDMLQYIPQGDLATVRFRMPSEMAFEVTKAFTGVFTTEISDENLRVWSSMASNAAVSMFNDSPMHMVAAYETGGDITIQDIALLYSDYMGFFAPLMAQNAEMSEGFRIEDNGIVQVDSVDFYSISMMIEPDSTTSMNFNYWMTVHEGVLLLESAPQPGILLGIISGDYTPALVEGTGDMAGEMSLAGYISQILAISAPEMTLPAIGTDVIIKWNGTFRDGSIQGEMSMDGSDAVATGFAFYGLISAATL
jgi:hypothetical protein